MQSKCLPPHPGPSPQPRKSSATPLPTALCYAEGSGTQLVISCSNWSLKQELAHAQKNKSKLWFLQYRSRKECTEWERWYIRYQSLKEERAQLKKSMSKAEPLMCNNGAEPGSLGSERGLCMEVLCGGCAWTTLSMENVHGTRAHAQHNRNLRDGFFCLFCLTNTSAFLWQETALSADPHVCSIITD